MKAKDSLLQAENQEVADLLAEVDSKDVAQSINESEQDTDKRPRVYPKPYYTENSSQYYNYDMKSAPLGTKLIVRNLGGTAAFAVLTHKNLEDFVAWAPLPIDHPDDKGRATEIMNQVLQKMRANSFNRQSKAM